MGKSSQPSGTTQVIQQSGPWSGQQPYLSNDFSLAQGYLNSNPLNYYPGQTLANFNPDLTSGLNSLGSAAQQGYQGTEALGQNLQRDAIYSGDRIANGTAMAENPTLGALTGMGTNAASSPGTASLAATAAGDYLNSNPYLSGMYNAAAQPVVNSYMTATAPQTDAAFEAAGRYGSGAQANAQSQNELNLGTTLGNLASNIYGSDYQAERQNQVNAASSLAGTQQNALNSAGGLYNQGVQQMLTNEALAPSTTAIPYTDLSQEISAGQGLTSLSQQQIDDAMARYYGNQAAPWSTLDAEAGLINGNYGSAGSTTEPYFEPSTASQLLGGGIGGAVLGSSLLGPSGLGLASAGKGAGLGSGLGALMSIL